MDLGLAKRTVVVTGASAGIGKAIAIAFGREGSRVAVTYLKSQARAEETVEAIRSVGGDAFAVRYDISDEKSIACATKSVLDKWHSVDVLINNAALVVPLGPRADSVTFENVPREVWQPTLASIEGTFATIQAVLPGMRASGWGRIVNISSNVAQDGLPGTGAYATAKAALHGLTAVLASELGSAGILVNVVIPGLTATERVLKSYPPQLKRRVELSTPTKRLTTPADIASIVVYLASAANGHVNGELIRVTGGL